MTLVQPELLAILCCPKCRSPVVETTAENIPNWLPGEEWAGALRCSQCGLEYPVTNDGIPIMWTDEIRAYMESGTICDDNLSANIAVYDRISDNYMAETRTGGALQTRFRTAVEHSQVRIGEDDFHLDIGCGPGHVIKWLSNLKMHHVGLDVSLSNVRNARASGAMAVLGDAKRLPFLPGSFRLVTGSAILHHIEEWRSCIDEVCRVTSADQGAIIFDSEPSKDQMNLGPLSMLVWNARYPAYFILSRVWKKKYLFRDLKTAHQNAELAEIHNQPGRGFDIEEITQAFDSGGFEAKIFLSPDERLGTVRPRLKRIVLHLLSGHNPWNPKYGLFTVIARARAVAAR